MKKTVKDAVDYFEWGWPYANPSMVYNYYLKEYDSWGSESDGALNTWDWQFVCTRKEFEQEVERQTKSQVSADWYDYDKQEAISLPPVGTECEAYVPQCIEWAKISVVAHDKSRAIWNNGRSSATYIGSVACNLRPLDWNRKQLQQEEIKHKTSHAALKAFEDFEGNFLQSFEHLYNIGALKPVDKWKK